MKKILIMLVAIFSMTFASSLRAQTIQVIGVVKDTDHSPVIGAVVMLEGNPSVGTVTDLDGKYTLNIPQGMKNPRLMFSCLSYITVTLDVTSSVVNVVLESDTEELEETVVVGYGSMRRSDLTGSVTSVKVDDEESARSTSIDQLLQGRAAGVHVTSSGGGPDGGVSISIRGMSSFNSGSQPLYVIDGIIVNSSGAGDALLSGSSDYTEETNGLMGLNPSDIAGIEILKDASATAIYGALGANGVILVTTKEARSEKPVVLVSVGMDVADRYKKMDIMSFDEYVDYLEIMEPTRLYSLYENPDDRAGLKVQPIDWQDYTMRTAVTQRYNVSVSGRPDKMSYNLSLGYMNSQGIIKNTEVDRYTMRLNMSNSFSKNFKLSFKANLSYIDSQMTQSTGSSSMTSATSMIRSMLSTRPYVSAGDIIDDDDEDADEDGEIDSDESGNIYRAGPDKWLTDFDNSRKEFRVTPSLSAEWRISRYLTFKSSIGGDYKNSYRVKFKSSRINSSTTGSNAGINHANYLSYNFDNMFIFNRKFRGGHSLSGTAGVTMYSNNNLSSVTEGWNIEQYKAQIEAINSSPHTRFAYSEVRNSTLSFLARAVYNYRDRYLLTATWRMDGSNKFEGANKWAHFPSFAAAWRINQEPWFSSRSISSAKLRLGWGQVGNQNIPNYRTFTNFGSAMLPSHTNQATSDGIVVLYPSNLANPDLKWETTEQVNLGLDLGLWKGRLSFVLDAYYKVTKDLLQYKKIAVSNGFSNVYVNEGSISNTGVELSISAVPVKTSDWEWTLDGNISFNRNKILEIDSATLPESIYLTADKATDEYFFYGEVIGSGSIANNPLNIFIKGQQMGLFYGLTTDGIVQEGKTGVPLSDDGAVRGPGTINYVDIDGNGYISDEDRTIIGNPNPDFIYGFSTSLRWKRLMLNMSFVGSQGNDVFNINAISEDHVSSPNNNHNRDAVFKAWTPADPDTNYPSLSGSTYYDRTVITDRNVEDGSYLRISNVSLSYSFPINKRKSKVLKGLSASFRVGNPYVWTRYSGWDPDVRSYGSSVMKMGVDAGSYPRSRTYSMDLKFTF